MQTSITAVGMSKYSEQVNQGLEIMIQEQSVPQHYLQSNYDSLPEVQAETSHQKRYRDSPMTYPGDTMDSTPRANNLASRGLIDSRNVRSSKENPESTNSSGEVDVGPYQRPQSEQQIESSKTTSFVQTGASRSGANSHLGVSAIKEANLM